MLGIGDIGNIRHISCQYVLRCAWLYHHEMMKYLFRNFVFFVTKETKKDDSSQL